MNPEGLVGFLMLCLALLCLVWLTHCVEKLLREVRAWRKEVGQEMARTTRAIEGVHRHMEVCHPKPAEDGEVNPFKC